MRLLELSSERDSAVEKLKGVQEKIAELNASIEAGKNAIISKLSEGAPDQEQKDALKEPGVLGWCILLWKHRKHIPMWQGRRYGGKGTRRCDQAVE